jgi:hypothetical protein
MAQTSKTDLKKYFETGDKPTQTEYAELIDAFRHVDDKLAIADVESLQASLDSKAVAATLVNHINDESAHNNSMTGAEIKTAYESEANTNAFTDTEKQQVADGVTHRSDSEAHVTTTDKTTWNNKLDSGGYVGTAQSLKDDIDGKVTFNTGGDPIKVFNELGQAIFTPQLRYSSVVIDSVNGDDTLGQLENFSAPFKTIQAALNAHRESTSYNPDNFLTVKFATAGDYSFEYLSTINVIFESNLAVNIKAVSTGDNFTANGLEVSHPHYSSNAGSLILDMPNGTFENRYIDDGTFVRQPQFQLENLIVRALKKIVVYNKTRLDYNYTGYSKVYPFRISNFCDLAYVDIETNMSFLFLANTAQKSKIHLGEVVIHKQDEAIEDATTSISNPIELVQAQAELTFSYTSITIAATNQPTHILKATAKVTAPFQFGDVVNDTTNSHCILFTGSNGSNEFILQFTNTNLEKCTITNSGYIRFTGIILSATSTKITDSGGSWIQKWTFDNFSGNFNMSDTLGETILHLYQIGANANNNEITTSLHFINTTINSKGTILILRDLSPSTTYPPVDFLGTNTFTSDAGEIVVGYLNAAVRIFKTGTLITNKSLHTNVSIIPISDSGYYQEIT